MATLSDDDIRTALDDLPGWEPAEGGGAVTKQYALGGFPAAVAFVVRLSYAAEKANHHPDLDIRYDKVRVTLSTHDQGGVTGKDVDLARAIEELAPPG